MSETLSIVIPAHNESENMLPLLLEVQAATQGLPVAEVIVVDDASVDGTEAALRKAKATIPLLRPVRHAHRAGQSAALMTGVGLARGTWIVTMDGDGQNNPIDIPKLYARLINDPAKDRIGLVAGQREKREDRWVKRISSRIANHVREALLQDGVRDTGCGLKILRRDVYMALPYFNHMHRYLPALVKREGYEIRLVDVSHRPRARGISKYGTLDRLMAGLYDLIGVMWLLKRAKIVQTATPIE